MHSQDLKALQVHCLLHPHQSDGQLATKAMPPSILRNNNSRLNNLNPSHNRRSRRASDNSSATSNRHCRSININLRSRSHSSSACNKVDKHRETAVVHSIGHVLARLRATNARGREGLVVLRTERCLLHPPLLTLMALLRRAKSDVHRRAMMILKAAIATTTRAPSRSTLVGTLVQAREIEDLFWSMRWEQPTVHSG